MARQRMQVLGTDRPGWALPSHACKNATVGPFAVSVTSIARKPGRVSDTGCKDPAGGRIGGSRSAKSGRSPGPPALRLPYSRCVSRNARTASATWR